MISKEFKERCKKARAYWAILIKHERHLIVFFDDYNINDKNHQKHGNTYVTSNDDVLSVYNTYNTKTKKYNIIK